MIPVFLKATDLLMKCKTLLAFLKAPSLSEMNNAGSQCLADNSVSDLRKVSVVLSATSDK